MPSSRRAAARSRPQAMASRAAPRYRSGSQQRKRRRKSARGKSMVKPQPTVLVIDDEIQIRRFLRAGFELDGCAVDEADCAMEGIRSATLKPPDLVILDLGLPDLD